MEKTPESLLGGKKFNNGFLSMVRLMVKGGELVKGKNRKEARTRGIKVPVAVKKHKMSQCAAVICVVQPPPIDLLNQFKLRRNKKSEIIPIIRTEKMPRQCKGLVSQCTIQLSH